MDGGRKHAQDDAVEKSPNSSSSRSRRRRSSGRPTSVLAREQASPVSSIRSNSITGLTHSPWASQRNTNEISCKPTNRFQKYREALFEAKNNFVTTTTKQQQQQQKSTHSHSSGSSSSTLKSTNSIRRLQKQCHKTVTPQSSQSANLSSNNNSTATKQPATPAAASITKISPTSVMIDDNGNPNEAAVFSVHQILPQQEQNLHPSYDSKISSNIATNYSHGRGLVTLGHSSGSLYQQTEPSTKVFPPSRSASLPDSLNSFSKETMITLTVDHNTCSDGIKHERVVSAPLSTQSSSSRGINNYSRNNKLQSSSSSSSILSATGNHDDATGSSRVVIREAWEDEHQRHEKTVELPSSAAATNQEPSCTDMQEEGDDKQQQNNNQTAGLSSSAAEDTIQKPSSNVVAEEDWKDEHQNNDESNGDDSFWHLFSGDETEELMSLSDDDSSGDSSSNKRGRLRKAKRRGRNQKSHRSKFQLGKFASNSLAGIGPEFQPNESTSSNWSLGSSTVDFANGRELSEEFSLPSIPEIPATINQQPQRRNSRRRGSLGTSATISLRSIPQGTGNDTLSSHIQKRNEEQLYHEQLEEEYDEDEADDCVSELGMSGGLIYQRLPQVLEVNTDYGESDDDALSAFSSVTGRKPRRKPRKPRRYLNPQQRRQRCVRIHYVVGTLALIVVITLCVIYGDEIIAWTPLGEPIPTATTWAEYEQEMMNNNNSTNHYINGTASGAANVTTNSSSMVSNNSNNATSVPSSVPSFVFSVWNETDDTATPIPTAPATATATTAATPTLVAAPTATPVAATSFITTHPTFATTTVNTLPPQEASSVSSTISVPFSSPSPTFSSTTSVPTTMATSFPTAAATTTTTTMPNETPSPSAEDLFTRLDYAATTVTTTSPSIRPSPLFSTLSPTFSFQSSTAAMPTEYPTTSNPASVDVDGYFDSSSSHPGLFNLLSGVSSDNGEALLTPNTPQNDAFIWLLSNLSTEDGIPYSDERLIQRYAMATVFFSTSGQRWTENTNWLSDENECLWYTTGRRQPVCEEAIVTRLELEANNLRGSIPPEIGLLTGLSAISLSNNLLTGNLPTEVINMPDIGSFDISDNAIFGELPQDILLFWENIQSFDVSHNLLGGTLPLTLLDASNLEQLDLEDNLFRGTLPSEIGRLENLQQLSISNNFLTGTVVTEIGRLSQLGILSLSHNFLTGEIPSEIGWLNLNILRMEENNFSGTLPEEVCFRRFLIIYADCYEENFECSCCTFCCSHRLGCECLYAETRLEFLCDFVSP